MPLVSPFPTGVVTVPDMDTFTSFPPFTFDPTNWLFLVLVYVCSFSLVQVFYLLVPYVSREKFPVALRNPERFPFFFLFLS